MGIEIERKFLVRPELLPPLPPPERFEQGYLSTHPVVRVRRVEGPGAAPQGKLTIKGEGSLSRAEFEYDIPASDAAQLLLLCGRSLRKDRHRLDRWDLDRFLDAEAPSGGVLWLAEIELSSEDEAFDRPAWLGAEVTHDPRYANSALARPR